MNTLDMLFESVEDDIELILESYNNFISQGEIFLAEEKNCESKKHLLEIINDKSSWEKRVNRFLDDIEKDKFEPYELRNLNKKLDDILIKGLNKVDIKNKSEIQSVSIGGENFILNEVLNKILTFIKNVNDCYVPTINGYMDDIRDDVQKGNRNAIVWVNMFDSLNRMKESLISMRDNCQRRYNRFMNHR